MRCRLCPGTDVWKFDLPHHFAEHHEGCDLLEEEVVTEAEHAYIVG